MSSFIQRFFALFRRSRPPISCDVPQEESSTIIGEKYFFNNPGPVVYLLQHGERAEYKIGCTKDLNTRINGIGLLMPDPIYLVHCIYTNDPEWLEKIWHKHFASKRRIGSGKRRASEWFNLSPEDVSEFKTHREWNNPAISYQPQLYLPLDVKVESNLEPQRRLPSEQKQINTTALSDKELAVRRVRGYFDLLKSSHPDCASKLIGACNFQIDQIDNELVRMKSNGMSTKEALTEWEKRARRSADAKIH